MKRSPAFWKQHLQTSKTLFFLFLTLLGINWIWKIYAGEGYTPPGFLTCITLISLLELTLAYQAKQKTEKENKNPPTP